MSYLINNQQKVNDIIFANRNKDYGAYAIRSSYGNTLLKSIMIMVTGFGTIVLTAYYLSNRSDKVELPAQIPVEGLIYQNVEVHLDPPEEKQAAKATITPEKPAGKPDVTASTTIADSTLLPEPGVTNDALTVASTKTGTSTGLIIPGGGGGGTGGKDSVGDNKKKGPLTLIGVDSQPEFEGGMKALYKFLSDNMRYPSGPASEGIEATVHVKFVVDESGKVSDVIVQNKSGNGFDEEALRVVSLIPKFKTPAKVNGEAVKVYYQLPIKFRLR